MVKGKKMDLKKALELFESDPNIVAVWENKEGKIVLAFKKKPDPKTLEALSYDNVIIFVSGEIVPLESLLPVAKSKREEKFRPCPAGVSVGHYKITAGTVGLCLHKKDGTPVLLSNNHVIADSVVERGEGGKIGDPILQPGPHDGGTLEDKIATLYDVVPLKREEYNLVDAAIGKPLKEEDLAYFDVFEYGKIEGWMKAREGMEVTKSGRSCAILSSIITSTNATVRVNYRERGTFTFTQQIIVPNPFGQPGDSGSPVIHGKGIVGLIYAGSPYLTVVCPFEPIKTRFDLDIEEIVEEGPPPPAPVYDFEGKLLIRQHKGKAAGWLKWWIFKFPISLDLDIYQTEGEVKGTAKPRKAEE